MVKSSITSSDNNTQYGAQVKYYGNSAAVCFQSSLLNEKMPTINVEIAPIVDRETDWNRKLNFQLSESELPMICGLLLGFLPILEIRRGHKGVELVRQKRDARNEPGLFIYASSGRDKQFRLLLPPGIMSRVGVLALSQFALDLDADVSLILPAIRSACALSIKS